jgi:hypothetical protein
MNRALGTALTAVAVLAPSAGVAAQPEIQRAQISSLTVYLSLPDGTIATQELDPARIDGLYWSERAVGVLATHYVASTTGIDAASVRRAWNAPGSTGCLPGFVMTDGASVMALEMPAASNAANRGQRAVVTGIQVIMSYPDGKQVLRTIDPKLNDCLGWSDEAVKVIGSFYAPGGPAEGKRMSREDLLSAFPNAASLIGDQPELLMTPDWVTTIWNAPKTTSTTPAYLSKTTINVING